MLLFYEGLPRSGKSYSCVKDYLIPQLQKKRHVYAYIEGLDHSRIAEASGLLLSEVEERLHVLKREDVPHIWKEGVVANSSFVVIDELQNFWPKSRAPLSPEMTQFVAEHGHRGLDILCMGQVLNECHSIWVGRMAQKVVFQKREAVGKPDEFRASFFKPVLKGDRLKWELIHTAKPEKYDPKYFGCYKSHTDDTDNKETLIDSRATVFASPILRRWLPAYGAVLVLALFYVFDFFTGGSDIVQVDQQQIGASAPPNFSQPASPLGASAPGAPSGLPSNLHPVLNVPSATALEPSQRSSNTSAP